MNIKKAAQDSAVVLLISFALLISSEIILRLIFPEEITPPMNKPNIEILAYQFNQHYLVSLKQGVNKTFTRKPQNGGKTIHWRTNNHAFRGPDLKTKFTRRIMVYGDSNIQARFSNDKNTFVRKLESNLSQHGFSNIDVINAGVVGFGPDQSLIKFSQEADIYKPNLVIFHVFADNDFGDIIRNRLFELNQSDQLKATDFPKTLDEHLQPYSKIKNSNFISTLLVVKAAHKIIRLLTVDTSNEYFNNMQTAANHEFAVYKASLPRKFSHFADHYDIDLALHPQQESSIMKVKLMTAVLSKAKEFANNKGIAFMVVIEPSVIDLTKRNSALSYLYMQQFPSYRRNHLTAIIRKICLDKNIPFIDLFDPFMKNNPKDLYFTANDHWNDAGQALAAKITARHIKSTKSLAKSLSVD